MSATPLVFAQFLLRCGYSILPLKLDGTKAPALDWSEYQRNAPTEKKLTDWFDAGRRGIGLVQGAVSGNAEMLECEDADTCDAFLLAIGSRLADRLTLRVASPGGGTHFYYRLTVAPAGNTKLACRPPTEQEAAQGVRARTLIETRGEGGMVVAPGSPLAVHATGRPYEILCGTFRDVPVLTEKEHEALFAAARSLDQMPQKPAPRAGAPWAPAPGTPRAAQRALGLGSGDTYNRNATNEDVLALLVEAGWQVAGQQGSGYLLTRPGKSTREGHSATLGVVAPAVFNVFSSSAAPFDPGRSYDAFGVLATLRHGGDFAAAGKALEAQGVGVRVPRVVAAGAQKKQSRAGGGDAEVVFDDGHLTDTGNAERLVRWFGNGVRWVPELGWRTWDGRQWCAGKEPVLRLVRETNRRMLETSAGMIARAAALRGQPSESERWAAAGAELAKWALKSESASRINALPGLVASYPEVTLPGSAFRSRPWVVSFVNGVWDRGRWRCHEREDYNETLIPVAYDEDADRTLWQQVLERMTGGDTDLQRTLQDVAGYAISGASSLRKLWWFYGPPGSGKSTIAEMLLTLLGGGGKQLDPSRLDDESEMERLGAAVRGTRLLVVQEAGRKRLSAEKLKTLSGGDRIPTRNLYQNASSDTAPTWALVAVSNHEPVVAAHDEALRGRVVAVPFVHALSDGPPLLGGDRIEALRLDPTHPVFPGFVSWVVEGMARVLSQGAVYECDAVLDATRRFWQDTDPLTPFWEQLEAGELESEQGMAPAALYASYVAWCTSAGVRKPIGQGRYWAAACRAAGLVEVRTSRRVDGRVETVRGWRRGEVYASMTDGSLFSLNPSIGNEIKKKLEKPFHLSTGGSSGIQPDGNRLWVEVLKLRLAGRLSAEDAATVDSLRPLAFRDPDPARCQRPGGWPDAELQVLSEIAGRVRV